MRHCAANVKSVQHRISILTQDKQGVNAEDRKTYFAKTSCENYNLIYFAHLLQKTINTRTLDHINVMPCVLNLHRYNIICLWY